VENGIETNPGKCKAIIFTRPWVTLLVTKKLRKRVVILILQSHLNWLDQVNYTSQKAWKALHFVMCVLNKRNGNT
jgi:hypothetical protein